jgi:hypothetical protein
MGASWALAEPCQAAQASIISASIEQAADGVFILMVSSFFVELWET